MQPCLGRVIVGSEGLQIHENWGLDRSKIMKNHGLEGLGGSLGAFWRSLAKLWRGFLRKLSPGEAQNRLRERQVGARAAQVGPCWRYDGDLRLNMEVLGSILGRFGVDLGAFWHMGRIAKIAKKRCIYRGF